MGLRERIVKRIGAKLESDRVYYRGLDSQLVNPEIEDHRTYNDENSSFPKFTRGNLACLAVTLMVFGGVFYSLNSSHYKEILHSIQASYTP